MVDLNSSVKNPLQILAVSLELCNGRDHVVSVPEFRLKLNLELSDFHQSALKCSVCFCRASFCDALKLVLHETFELRQITSEHASYYGILHDKNSNYVIAYCNL